MIKASLLTESSLGILLLFFGDLASSPMCSSIKRQSNMSTRSSSTLILLLINSLPEDFSSLNSFLKNLLVQ